MTTSHDGSAGFFASWHLGDEIEKVVKRVTGKGFNSADDELAVDIPRAFLHAVNLAYRYFHSLSQFGQVLISPRA
jgi:hypothetical protein